MGFIEEEIKTTSNIGTGFLSSVFFSFAKVNKKYKMKKLKVHSLKLTTRGILHYLLSAHLSKTPSQSILSIFIFSRSFSQLIMSVFIFFNIFFRDYFTLFIS